MTVRLMLTDAALQAHARDVAAANAERHREYFTAELMRSGDPHDPRLELTREGILRGLSIAEQRLLPRHERDGHGAPGLFGVLLVIVVLGILFGPAVTAGFAAVRTGEIAAPWTPEPRTTAP